MLLSNKYPFLAKYFDTAISNKLNNKGVPITHSILFYGQDLESQLILAKDIARKLNCKGDLSDECNCLSCRWIRENSHPSVKLITSKDNKPSDDKSKMVISIKQANMIKNSLLTTSDDYRVFIFFDKDNDDNVVGLNPINFQEETANSMLKMIEEPSENVLFIFLTNNKEDILPTIVSRCQSFSVSNLQEFDYSFSAINEVFSEYWNFNRADAFDIAQKLETLAKNTSAEDVLMRIEFYIYNLLKTNPTPALINDLKTVELARKQVSLGMSSNSVFESLCLKLIQ